MDSAIFWNEIDTISTYGEIKKMARYRCYNCRLQKIGFYREFAKDRPECDHCGAGAPAVVELLDIHFLASSSNGPIEGKNGRRFFVCCMPKREYLSVGLHDNFAATGDPRAVTCPICIESEAFKKFVVNVTQYKSILINNNGCCD